MTAPDEKIMERVAALIAKAERTENDHEKAAYFAKADALVHKYALDMAQINSLRSKDEREKPTQAEINFPWSDWDSELSFMLRTICEASRVRIVRKGYLNKFVIVGFAADIEYVQIVWMSVHLAFMAKLNPTWSKDREFDLNVKILKEAGFPWGAIANQANANGFPDVKSNDGKLKAAYRRQCRAEGVEPTNHTQRPKAYRTSYAMYFRHSIQMRLYDQVEAQRKATETSGAALALRDRISEVDDLFYSLFPNLSPEAQRLAQEARDRAEEERRAKMTPKEREEEDRQNEKDNARFDKAEQLRRKRLYDASGAKAGRSAGNSVDLSAGRNHVKETSRNQIGN